MPTTDQALDAVEKIPLLGLKFFRCNHTGVETPSRACLRNERRSTDRKGRAESKLPNVILLRRGGGENTQGNFSGQGTQLGYYPYDR